MSSTEPVLSTVETLRAAIRHKHFFMKQGDFAVQTVHVLGQDHLNIWRKALLASESVL